mgnify:CR=1 FL=1
MAGHVRVRAGDGRGRGRGPKGELEWGLKGGPRHGRGMWQNYSALDEYLSKVGANIPAGAWGGQEQAGGGGAGGQAGGTARDA